MSQQLDQNDLDEMKMCLGDCQLKTEKDKEDVQQCASKNSLRKFFLRTIPGNVLIILILYFLVHGLVDVLKK